VLAEVAYLVGRTGGVSSVAAFLRGLPDSRFRLVALEDQDIARIANILQAYEDSRIDFVDASVMTVAERFGLSTILTLDRRDFQIFRPSHCTHFQLLPALSER
jgi:predicted nucleic acid-binding protein